MGVDVMAVSVGETSRALTIESLSKTYVSRQSESVAIGEVSFEVGTVSS